LPCSASKLPLARSSLCTTGESPAPGLQLARARRLYMHLLPLSAFEQVPCRASRCLRQDAKPLRYFRAAHARKECSFCHDGETAKVRVAPCVRLSRALVSLAVLAHASVLRLSGSLL